MLCFSFCDFRADVQPHAGNTVIGSTSLKENKEGTQGEGGWKTGSRGSAFEKEEQLWGAGAAGRRSHRCPRSISPGGRGVRGGGLCRAAGTC